MKDRIVFVKYRSFDVSVVYIGSDGKNNVDEEIERLRRKIDKCGAGDFKIIGVANVEGIEFMNGGFGGVSMMDFRTSVDDFIEKDL